MAPGCFPAVMVTNYDFHPPKQPTFPAAVFRPALTPGSTFMEEIIFSSISDS
jgi:hypothetical protein